MSTVRCNSLDGELDVGERSAPAVAHSESDRDGSTVRSRKSPANKYVAIALVAIMMVSAFAMVSPVGNKKTQAPERELPATAEAVGPPEFEYVISNIGESYAKSTIYADLGRHISPGLSAWWGPEGGTFYRHDIYGDTVIHNSYPYVVAYNPYSGNLFGEDPKLSFTTHSFYRLSTTAKNLLGLGTGAGKDPNVLPLRSGDLSADGGNVQMNMYFTYITLQETQHIWDGTHYANTYYGVPDKTLQFTGADYYDGWWIEGQGKITFDRNAAHKFLGLNAGATDMRTEFNTVNDPAGPASNVLGKAWEDEWEADGAVHAKFDIYAAYDYDINSGSVDVYLTLDPTSSPDVLVVRLWSRSWGAEFLHMRYLDVAGIRHNLGPSPEDWYLNMTLTPEAGNVQERVQADYQMTAWRDMSAFTASWMIEAQHVDYTSYGYTVDPPEWVSQYNPYCQWFDSDDTYVPVRKSWSPGQPTYGTNVQYWYTPMDWNLVSGEVLKVKLPMTAQGWGVVPYKSTIATLDDAKVTEMNANSVTGEWVLGHGWPSWYYSTTYYDAATKTLTFTGPLTMPLNPNPVYSTICESGSPQILLDISKVSKYSLALVGNPSPIIAGTSYNLQVTPLNLAGSQVYSNQTVELPAIAGVTYGPSTHKFLVSESSWTTTVTFASAGTYNLVARDQSFYLDVSDSYPFVVESAGGFTLNLVAGWNFVSVPPVGYGYTASMLGGVVDQVAAWDPLAKAYTIWWSLFPEENDFAIQGSTGYWVLATGPGTLTLLGDIPTTTQTRAIAVPPGGGWAIVGFNSLKTTWTASDIVGMYTAGAVDQVAAWDPVAKGYIIWWSFFPDENDFSLVPGQAFWVLLTASGTLTYAP